MKTEFSPDSVQEPKPQPKLVKLVMALKNNYIYKKLELEEVVREALITFENNLAQRIGNKDLARSILFYFCWPWHVFVGSTPLEGLKEHFKVDSFEEIDFKSLVEGMKPQMEEELEQKNVKIENIENIENFINSQEIKSLNLQIFEIVIRAIIEHEDRILNKEISTLIKEVFGEEFLNRVLNSNTNQIN
jgi:hypothetical protein